MSLCPPSGGGHYDTQGQWVRTKHCFAYCGVERCDCAPSNGVYYSPMHDQRLKAPVSGDAQVQESPGSALHDEWLQRQLQSDNRPLPERCPWDEWRPARTIA